MAVYGGCNAYTVVKKLLDRACAEAHLMVADRRPRKPLITKFVPKDLHRSFLQSQMFDGQGSDSRVLMIGVYIGVRHGLLGFGCWIARYISCRILTSHADDEPTASCAGLQSSGNTNSKAQLGIEATDASAMLVTGLGADSAETKLKSWGLVSPPIRKRPIPAC